MSRLSSAADDRNRPRGAAESTAPTTSVTKAARGSRRSSSATPSSTRPSSPVTTSGSGSPRRVARGRRAVRDELGCTYFGFLSAIDWMPSPYGPRRGRPDRAAAARSTAIVQVYAGASDPLPGLRPVHSPTSHVGITLKADVPDDDLRDRRRGRRSTPAPTGTSARRGRCSASTSSATRTSATSTCPAEFEGYPLRKDFPLIARMVKPWPGIVDVEPMPGGRRRRGRGAAKQEQRRDRRHRSPAAGLHRGTGRGRPRQRRVADRGHDPEHRAAAPGDARHLAHHRPPRRRAGGRGPIRSWATCTAATRSSPRSAPSRR